MSAVASLNALYGALLVVAALCGLGVPKAQRPMFAALVAVMCANWLAFLLSYTEYAPMTPFWRLGLSIASQEGWKLGDALVGLTALISYRLRGGWWNVAIYVLCMTQLSLHALYWEVPIIGEATYFPAQDHVFQAQLAVLIAAGGPGVVNRIVRLFSVCRVGNALSALASPQVTR